MDFLDPRKKRATKIRLFIGYGLVSIVIALATLILVYAAYGYGINTKTGAVIQNGLLYADSQPRGASIYLNGQLQNSKTASRLVLPAGAYTLSIQKAGYKSWRRTLSLDEHTVARYVYPFLFPADPYSVGIKTYPAMPPLITETPDRRWLLVEAPESTQGNLIFDQFDTGALAKAPLKVALPKNVLTPADNSTYKMIEWSTNNNQVLLEHTYPGGSEFIVFDRTNPQNSFNVNSLFNVDPVQVALKNKKADQLYLYFSDGSLEVGDSGQATVSSPILKHILAFKPYGNSIIFYISAEGAPSGEVTAKILDNDKNYTVYSFVAGDTYLLDEAQFQGDWYYVAGSDKADRVNIYKNPEDYINNPTYKKAEPLYALDNVGANKLSFSDNARFIGVENGQNFAVYDLENNQGYRYRQSAALASTPLAWMDGHRWIGESNNQVYVFDYDNANKVYVAPSALPTGGFFDQGYAQMITLTAAKDGSSYVLERVDMRAGTDLPKDHSQ